MILQNVIKRDGSLAPYDKNRIFQAIIGANNDSTEKINEDEIRNITDKIEGDISGLNKISVEEIQDIVERYLMESGYFEVAKKYICYRYKHMLRRKSKKNLMEVYTDILFTDAKNSDNKRENANINTNAPMGIMLKLGTEGSKYFLSEMMPERFISAHQKGFVHKNDLDFSMITLNCCQIDLLKLFKNGFSTGLGHIREPQSIRSYASLACIAIQSNQSDMLGGTQ